MGDANILCIESTILNYWDGENAPRTTTYALSIQDGRKELSSIEDFNKALAM